MEGTQLYNKDKTAIFPNTKATNVGMTNNEHRDDTVESCILDLYNKYGNLTGLNELKNLITVAVKYKTSDQYAESDELKRDADWKDTFLLPTSVKPYTWKRTQFTFDGDVDPKTFYEIVATNIAEKTQTFYLATNNTNTPEIRLNSSDVQNDDFNPGGNWSANPVSISASNPNLYIATRVKKNGVWLSEFSVALIGKWAYDSIVVLKYKTTELDSDKPTLTLDENGNPTDWSDNINIDSTFTGKIWQITATSVNGILNSVNGKIWNGPNLISIIK